MANQAQSIAEDLMVGAGVLYFERDDDTHGLHHLGNVDEFNITTDVTTVEKNSSMNKRRELMASVTTAVKPTATLTLTEYNPYNMALGLFGTENVHKQAGVALNSMGVEVISVPGMIELKDKDGNMYYDVSDVVVGLSNPQPVSFKWKNVSSSYSVDETGTILTDNHEVPVPAKVAFVASSAGTAYTADPSGLVFTDNDTTNGGGTITLGIADGGFVGITEETSVSISVTNGTTATGDTEGLKLSVVVAGGSPEVLEATGGSTEETFTLPQGFTITVNVPSGTGLVANPAVFATLTTEGVGSAGGTITLGTGTYSSEYDDTVYVSVEQGNTEKGNLAGLKLVVLEGALGGQQVFTASSGTTETFTLLSGATVTVTVTENTQIVASNGMIEAEERAALSEYKAGKDYILDAQMLRAGLVQIPAGSRIQEGERVLVSAKVPENDFITVSGSSAGEISGRLLFIGDPNNGGRYNIEAWKVKVRPDGDFTGLISSDFGSFNLTIDFLADYEHHPDYPFYKATLIGRADGKTKNSGVYNPNY